MKNEDPYLEQEIYNAFNKAQEYCYYISKNRGWHDVNVGFPTRIALIHSEISEALEADRKDLMDEKIPYRKGKEVELADAMIRIFDTAEAEGLDLAGAFLDKCIINISREDHSLENRIKQGGKKY